MLPGPGNLELVWTAADGVEKHSLVYKFEGAGVGLAMYNTDESIRAFAESCFAFALDKQMCVPVYGNVRLVAFLFDSLHSWSTG